VRSAALTSPITNRRPHRIPTARWLPNEARIALQVVRKTLVQQNAHWSSGVASEFERGNHLSALDRRELMEKLVDGVADLEVVGNRVLKRARLGDRLRNGRLVDEYGIPRPDAI
jgi:hypothetical protein